MSRCLFTLTLVLAGLTAARAAAQAPPGPGPWGVNPGLLGEDLPSIHFVGGTVYFVGTPTDKWSVFVPDPLPSAPWWYERLTYADWHLHPPGIYPLAPGAGGARGGAAAGNAPLAALASAAVARAGDDKEDAAAKELKALEGNWQLTQEEERGFPTPKAVVANLRVVIDGGKMSWYIGNPAPPNQTADLTVDPTTDPKSIDALITQGSAKDKKMLGSTS